MLSLAAGRYRFDLRAAAVILDGSRVLLHRPDNETFWSLPGGRVEAGEAAADAVAREMMEELDLAVQVPGELWTIENFFELPSGPVHEVGLYFIAVPEPGSLLERGPGPYQGREGGQVLHYAWFERAGLQDVPLLPRVLKTLLARELEPGHHVERS